MKSAAKLIRRFVSILLLSAVLLVIINVAVYAVLVSEKAPTETTSPYDIAEKAGEALQVLPDGTYCLSEEVSSELEEKNIWAIFRSFIDFAGNSITAKMETLLAGGYIIERIEENLTYDYLHASEDNLWSILYLTGYLTKVRDRDIKMPLPDGMTALLIPNAEIREIFETTVKKWFEDKARTWNKRLLFDAVWCGDSETLTQEMNKLLRQTISYHDYREDFYHAFLAGIFTGAGYMVQSNKEHGEGRSDLVVMDTENGRVAVFEAKYSKMFQQLESDCNKAINQIESRMYAREFEENGDDVFCYGIAFFKKRCCVKIKS